MSNRLRLLFFSASKRRYSVKNKEELIKVYLFKSNWQHLYPAVFLFQFGRLEAIHKTNGHPTIQGMGQIANQTIQYLAKHQHCNEWRLWRRAGNGCHLQGVSAISAPLADCSVRPFCYSKMSSQNPSNPGMVISQFPNFWLPHIHCKAIPITSGYVLHLRLFFAVSMEFWKTS